MHDNDKLAADFYLREISSGNAAAFEQLFFEYYYPLCGFAVKITKQSELARDAVQDVFFKIWKNRQSWEVKSSLKAYLYQAVRHQALNLMEQQKSRDRLSERWKEEMNVEREKTNGSPVNSYSEKLVGQIWELVEKMPPQRKMVFELHRKYGLSYPEIAEVMNITRKTVENHMGKALDDLRKSLDIGRFLQD